jgi:hypothetical protein
MHCYQTRCEQEIKKTQEDILKNAERNAAMGLGPDGEPLEPARVGTSTVGSKMGPPQSATGSYVAKSVTPGSVMSHNSKEKLALLEKERDLLREEVNILKASDSRVKRLEEKVDLLASKLHIPAVAGNKSSPGAKGSPGAARSK